MAKVQGNLLLENISGKIGRQLVIKQYRNKTVIAVYPNKPVRRETPLKMLYEGWFAEAVV